MTLDSLRLEGERGTAIVEFCLVIPLIILFAFAGLEYSRMVRETQIASSLAHVFADVAYRDCAAERNGAKFDASDCLQLVHQRLRAQWQGLAGASEVVVSMYRFDGVVSLEAQVVAGSQPSAYSVAKLNLPNSSVGDITRSQEVIIIAEVFLPFSSSFSFIRSSSPAGNFLYDVAII